ncbi:MAG TPA: hypothetical protein VH025_05055 [Solirubrobacteraceae bacterium]|jgi:hypothetical protein|nr:hypothetical protein [Solirubrobacteraceae bacterium]
MHLSSGEPTGSGAIGLLLVAAGDALATSSACVASANPLAGLVFLLAALRFVLGGIYELGASATWQHVSAIVGLTICALVLYAVLAF